MDKKDLEYLRKQRKDLEEKQKLESDIKKEKQKIQDLKPDKISKGLKAIGKLLDKLG